MGVTGLNRLGLLSQILMRFLIILLEISCLIICMSKRCADINLKESIMSMEDKAQGIADAFQKAENAVETLVRTVKANLDDFSPTVGPLTTTSFLLRLQGALGDIISVHLDMSPYDPRPRPMDGGGK